MRLEGGDAHFLIDREEETALQYFSFTYFDENGPLHSSSIACSSAER